MGDEDYTGCSFTCSPSSGEALGLIGGFEADCTIVLVNKVAKGGWGQVYLGEIDGGTGGFAAIKVGGPNEAPACSHGQICHFQR